MLLQHLPPPHLGQGSEGRGCKTGHNLSAARGFTAEMLRVSLWGRGAVLPIFSRLLHPLPGTDASGSRWSQAQMLVAGLATRPNKYTVAAEHWQAAPAHRAGRLGACYLTAIDSLGVAKSGSLRGGQDGCCWLSSFSSLLKSFLDAFFLRSLRKQLSMLWSRAVCSKEKGRRGFEEGVAQTGTWDGMGFAKPP